MNITYSHNYTSSTNSLSKRIDLQEDKISVTEFLKKFEKGIYKYIKHSHRALWKYIQFKKSCDVFPVGTIFSVVDFEENYIFESHKKYMN